MTNATEMSTTEQADFLTRKYKAFQAVSIGLVAEWDRWLEENGFPPGGQPHEIIFENDIDRCELDAEQRRYIYNWIELWDNAYEAQERAYNELKRVRLALHKMGAQ